MSGAKSGGQWGITYKDVGEAQDQYEAEYHCTIEWATWRVRKHRDARYKVWQVVCYARWRSGRPDEVRGTGMCDVGGNRGAASMPGAYLRAMLDACSDLERRRTDKRYDRDTPAAQLPGF